MPQIKYPNPTKLSHEIDSVNVAREKLYLLAGCISASKYIAKDCVDFIPGLGSTDDENARATLRGLLDDFENKHFATKLLETAVLCRVHRQSKILPNKTSNKNSHNDLTKNIEVGKLSKEGKTEKLYLKDAFDKIIHADEIYIDYKNLRTLHKRHIDKIVKLKGAYNNRKWTAHINLKEYIKFSAYYVSF